MEKTLPQRNLHTPERADIQKTSEPLRANESKLDRVEPITSRYNQHADSAMEKTLSQYNLHTSERDDIQKARDDCKDKQANEKALFANPNEWENRKQDAIRLLTEKHGQLGARPKGPDGIPGYLTPNQIENRAVAHVYNDHVGRLKNFESNRDASIKATLSQAAAQGRGPEPEKEREEHNDRNLSQTFERNR